MKPQNSLVTLLLLFEETERGLFKLTEFCSQTTDEINILSKKLCLERHLSIQKFFDHYYALPLQRVAFSPSEFGIAPSESGIAPLQCDTPCDGAMPTCRRRCFRTQIEDRVCQVALPHPRGCHIEKQYNELPQKCIGRSSITQLK